MGFNANVNTTARPAASFQTPGSGLWFSFAVFFGLVFALSRKRRTSIAILIACLLLVPVLSCGSGKSVSSPTPAGTFPFSVNASANGVTHSKTMVLVVK